MVRAGQVVLNERAMGYYGKLIRPDRIIMRPDKTAVIVDYKFGTHRNDAAYGRQVARYAKALVKAGAARRCECYVWYVALGEVVSL